MRRNAAYGKCDNIAYGRINTFQKTDDLLLFAIEFCFSHSIKNRPVSADKAIVYKRSVGELHELLLAIIIRDLP